MGHTAHPNQRWRNNENDGNEDQTDDDVTCNIPATTVDNERDVVLRRESALVKQPAFHESAYPSAERQQMRPAVTFSLRLQAVLHITDGLCRKSPWVLRCSSSVHVTVIVRHRGFPQRTPVRVNLQSRDVSTRGTAAWEVARSTSPQEQWEVSS